jgi:biotin operon repressor
MTKSKEKKQQTTRKPIKISERREFIDPETGQKVDQYIFKVEDRDANFHKLWLWHIAAALDLIGNQKIKILSYILANTQNNNIFIGTMRDIAEKLETSKDTVNTTIQMLMDADILKRQQSGVYLINPEVIFKGGTNQRMDILYQYYTNEPKKGKKTK